MDSDENGLGQVSKMSYRSPCKLGYDSRMLLLVSLQRPADSEWSVSLPVSPAATDRQNLPRRLGIPTMTRMGVLRPVNHESDSESGPSVETRTRRLDCPARDSGRGSPPALSPVAAKPVILSRVARSPGAQPAGVSPHSRSAGPLGRGRSPGKRKMATRISMHDIFKNICFCVCMLIPCAQAVLTEHMTHDMTQFSTEMQHYCEEVDFLELSEEKFTALLTRLNINVSIVQLISSLEVTSLELLDMSYEELQNMISLSPNDIWRIAQCILHASVEGRVLDDTDPWNCISPTDIMMLVHISLKSLLFRCSGSFAEILFSAVLQKFRKIYLRLQTLTQNARYLLWHRNIQ
jgi:hypothetical protein